MAQKLGGWSEPMKATEDIRKICDQVKEQVEEETGQNYLVFKAVLYRKQIVAGENFLIKVFAGEEDYLHLCVFRALPCDGGQIVLKGVQQHKTKGDPLVPFDPVILGGWSEPMKATEDTQKISDHVKEQVEKMTGKNYHAFKAVLYRQQIVAGENFLIKVFAGEEDYVHLSVFRALPCNGGGIKLKGAEQHKTKGDPLVPFTN